VADIFLRRDGAIVAVLSVLREAALGRFGSDELGLLLKLQPFLEYALNSVYFPKRTRERQTVQARYKLTDREVDVLEWIIAGASNKMIARELAVGLATVKTHMQHLFAKVKVTSRISLLARSRDVIKS
jgi:ATP/maltotriose-dependent transcriptional regulator MalT